MSKSYHEQFRDKNQNGFNPNSRTKPNGKLPPPRPTAAKQQSPRSDTYLLPAKRNETQPKIPKNNSTQNGSRRLPPREPAARSFSPSLERRRAEPMRRNDTIRSVPKYVSSSIDEELGRKPIRFAGNRKNNNYPSSSPPAYYQKSAPLPRDASDKPRRMRIANNEYIIQRRRQPRDNSYDDYRMDSPIERTRPQRVVRVLRDPPYEEDDDVYYVEQKSSRRLPPIHRSPQTEYVYVDETPPPPSIRRPRRSRRPEVVYIDEDQPIEYEDEYIYVDENGNEVDYMDERSHSPPYVEYIYDDDRDRRRSHKAKVIYVDDEPSHNYGRNRKKPKQPSSTRIIYE